MSRERFSPETEGRYRKGQVIQYIYDGLNRLTHKGYPDATGVDYVYDLVGKIKQVTDPTGTYGFAYDNMGRLIGTTTQYTFLPGHTYTNSYTHDAASNRTGFTAPDGSTNSYAYDTLGRLSTLTDSGAGQFTYNYDVLSRRMGLNRPNGVNTTYSYDSVSRLLNVLHKAGTMTLDGAGYTYDNAGNRTSKTNYLNSITEQYTYDPLYQLTQVTQGATTTESYSYDPVGNRLSSLGMSPYAYNSSNQLTSTPAATFTYDANGNTLSKTDSSGTRNYTWDFENRLIAAAVPATGTVSFKYDPFGRRIQKTSTSGTTNYLYGGANSIEELDASGTEAGRYSQGLGYDAPLAMTRGGASSFYEQDGNDSVTSLSSSTGTISNSYTYDAFGILTTSAGSLTNPFQYTARDYDAETGLRYYRNRYYDSNVGRFLNEDPLGFHGGDSNFYTYVVNSPTDLVDPLGLQHKQGGPYHPIPQSDGTVRCNAGPNRTQGDSCQVIMAKMVQIAITLASHVRWDEEHGGNKHFTTDLYSWQGAFMRCLEMFNRYCAKDDCPKPSPKPGDPPTSPKPPKPWWYFEWIPVIPRIPGPLPFMPSPCFSNPTLPGCPLDPGRNGSA